LHSKHRPRLRLIDRETVIQLLIAASLSLAARRSLLIISRSIPHTSGIHARKTVQGSRFKIRKKDEMKNNA
jgi:hypothetical protein